MALQTEYEFVLPKGYVKDGEVHREGLMRLSTAADEILPMKDPRVRANEDYLPIIVLSRVIVRLGTVDDVTPKVVEDLFREDFVYLEHVYERINSGEGLTVHAECPECRKPVEVELGMGES